MVPAESHKHPYLCELFGGNITEIRIAGNFNTGQKSKFTSETFMGDLLKKSIWRQYLHNFFVDRLWRKHEVVYHKEYVNLPELLLELRVHFNIEARSDNLDA